MPCSTKHCKTSDLVGYPLIPRLRDTRMASVTLFRLVSQNKSCFHYFQVLGVVRCPLYVMRDKQGGLPSFLQNNFVGNSRQQFLIGLEHASILSQEEIQEALRLSQLIQMSLAKL